MSTDDILAHVDATIDERLQRLFQLIRIPSVSTDPTRAEDCRRAAVILTRLKAPAQCGAGLVIDREALAARGATTLRFLGGDAVEIRSVRKGTEIASLARAEARTVPETQNRPQTVRPVPEQDLPEEEVSSDEPD